MALSKIKALILTLDYPHRASNYNDWTDAFRNSLCFSSFVDGILNLKPAALARKIDEYDAVILLHSCNADTLEYLAPLAPILAERKKAKLLSFVGNEYNSPYLSAVRRNQLLREARVDIVATQLLRDAGEYQYRDTGARVIAVPHALNPAAFRPGDDNSPRSLDIGFKGYRYPPFLGDDDRNRMIRQFKIMSQRLGLVVDISEDKRLPRDRWARFLGNCRGTISTESGSWFIEPHDTLINKLSDHLKANRTGIVIKNDSFARRSARRLPMPVKAILWKLLKLSIVKFEIIDDFNISFEELNERFFRNAQRAPVYGKCISSRHFDAVGTKTCQLLMRGRFNDILVADEHYIAVDPDFLNVEDAVCRFKDPAQRQRIVDRAYNHVMSGHTYAHRTRYVHHEIERLP